MLSWCKFRSWKFIFVVWVPCFVAPWYAVCIKGPHITHSIKVRLWNMSEICQEWRVMSNIVSNEICYVFIQNSFLVVASERPIILRIDDRKSAIVPIINFKIGSNLKNMIFFCLSYFPKLQNGPTKLLVWIFAPLYSSLTRTYLNTSTLNYE